MRDRDRPKHELRGVIGLEEGIVEGRVLLGQKKRLMEVPGGIDIREMRTGE